MNEFLQTWNDPSARHAMLVHWPIVLGAAGVIPLFALAFSNFRNTTLKALCIVWFLLASLAAALAANSGELAEAKASTIPPPITEAEHAAIERHEDLGDGGWIWPLIPAALAAATFVPRRRIAVIAGSLALVAGIGVAGWVALTAQAGGRIVYVHGLGVPARGATVPDQSAPAQPPQAPAAHDAGR